MGNGSLDAETVSAMVPGVAGAAAALGGAAGAGGAQTVVVRLEHGVAVVQGLSDEVLLAVLLAGGTGFAPLLRDLADGRGAWPGWCDRPSTDDGMTDAHDPHPRRVLVADDEPHIGHIIRLKLEQGPYQVVLVSSGTEALEHLRGDEPIDVVLLDIMMPGATGLEVLEEARAMPHRRDTPIIILTAKGQDADRRQALELGATDFFTKPFSPKKLLARVDELFGAPADAGERVSNLD